MLAKNILLLIFFSLLEQTLSAPVYTSSNVTDIDDDYDYTNSTTTSTDTVYGVGGANLFGDLVNQDEQDEDSLSNNSTAISYGYSNGTDATDGIMDKKAKRYYTVVEIENYYDYMYLATLEIGSTGQKVKVQVDTGSTDLWVASNLNCDGDMKAFCNELGSFDMSKSKTLKDKKKTFVDAYGSSLQVTNEWVQDTVKLGDLKFKNLWFGVTKKINMAANVGMLGLNYYQDKKTITSKFKKPANAKKLGFGIYVGKAGHGSKGTLIFGGMDTAKINGSMQAISTINASTKKAKKQTSWKFLLKSMKVGDKSLSSESYPVLLDTGFTSIGLPNTVFKNLVDKLGAKKDSNNNYSFSCSKKQRSEDYKFEFEGKTIYVPAELVYSVNGDTCTLTSIVNNGGSEYQLGDYFFRHAYVYFDVNKKSALIGQAQHSSKTNYVAMTKDVNVKKKVSQNVFDPLTDL